MKKHKFTFREGSPTSLIESILSGKAFKYLLMGKLPLRYLSILKFVEHHRKFFFRKILKTLPLKCNPKSEVEIHSLVCQGDLEMYLLAVKSFLRFYNDISVIVHDDGSLTNRNKFILKKHIRNIKFIKQDNRKKLERLPLVKRFINQGMEKTWILKLVEINFLNKSKKTIILDSDIIFLRRPIEIINWIEKNQNISFYNQSNVCTLRNAKGKIEKQYKLKVPGNLTAGFIGFKNDISIKEIEKYFPIYQDYPEIDQGDQSIYQLLLAKRNAKSLDKTEYLVFDGNNYNPKAKMVHFIYPHRFKKYLYLKLARKVINELKIW